MTADDVKRELSACVFCYREIKRLEDIVARLRANAERITPKYSKTPPSKRGGGGNGHLEADVITMLTMEQNYKAELVKYHAILNKTLDAIDKVPDDTQRAILREHFVYGQSFADIATALAFSEMQIYRMYGKALQFMAEQNVLVNVSTKM